MLSSKSKPEFICNTLWPSMWEDIQLSITFSIIIIWKNLVIVKQVYILYKIRLPRLKDRNELGHFSLSGKYL